MNPPRRLSSWLPDRSEVIWINHNPQAGRERKDHHPFLVLSPAPFHAAVGLVVGCTMTFAATNQGSSLAVDLGTSLGCCQPELVHPSPFWRSSWLSHSAAVHSSGVASVRRGKPPDLGKEMDGFLGAEQRSADLPAENEADLQPAQIRNQHHRRPSVTTPCPKVRIPCLALEALVLAKRTSKNQLTLPKSVVEDVGNADYYDVIVEDGRIVLTPVHPGAAAAVRNRLAELGIGEADIAEAVRWARQE
jgi:hypothetical protein